MILAEAAKCTSIITRRRALLGVARNLGVESIVYPLFMSYGLARDSAIAEMLRPAMKSHRRIRLAVDKFSGGDERAALDVLAHAKIDSRLEAFLETYVDESFLVASAFAARVAAG
jgi:hypothetical protein